MFLGRQTHLGDSDIDGLNHCIRRFRFAGDRIPSVVPRQLYPRRPALSEGERERNAP